MTEDKRLTDEEISRGMSPERGDWREYLSDEDEDDNDEDDEENQ